MPPHHVISESGTISRGPFATALAALLLAACGTGEQTPRTLITERDSAGITIVEHTAEAIAALPTWTIENEPARVLRDTIGLTAVGLAVQWSDDRVVLRDNGLRGLWVFRFDDDLAMPLALRGQGPGEVQYVASLQRLPGDTLAAFDTNSRRLSFFGPDGRFVRSRPYPQFPDGAEVRVNRLLPDGRIFGTTAPPYVPPTGNWGILRRDTIAIVAFREPDAGSDRYGVDTIVRVPDGVVFSKMSVTGGEPWPNTDFLRLGPDTHMALLGSSLWVGTNERFELRRYERDTLRQLVRVLVTPKPVPADAAERVKASSRASLVARRAPAQMQAEVEEEMAGWQFATEFPYHGRLLPGLDGTLWAEERWVLVEDPRRFLVFDVDGRALANVELPSGVVPLQVSRDGILATRNGEDGVPQIGLWKLRP